VTSFSQMIVEYETGKIKMVWTAPQSNGSPITAYVLQRDVGSGVFFNIYTGVQPSYNDSGLLAG